MYALYEPRLLRLTLERKPRPRRSLDYRMMSTPTLLPQPLTSAPPPLAPLRGFLAVLAAVLSAPCEWVFAPAVAAARSALLGHLCGLSRCCFQFSAPASVSLTPSLLSLSLGSRNKKDGNIDNELL